MSTATQAPPVVDLQTKFGPIKVSFTDGGHAYAYTSDGGFGSTPLSFITFRDQEFRVSAHLYAKGDWAPGDFAPSVTKRVFGSGPSARTHREAIMGAIITAVREFASANPQVLAQAQRFRLEDDLLGAQRSEDEAAAALVLAQVKRQSIEDQIASL